MRQPYLMGDALWVPSVLIRNARVLNLKSEEVVLILHVCNFGLKSGDTLPAPTLSQLAKLMGLDRSSVFRWKASLEKKGYLISKPKIAEDGRTEAAYWDLTPLWKAVDGLSTGSTSQG